MSTSTVMFDRSQSMAAQIASGSTDVPTLDTLVFEILRVADNPNASVSDLIELISKDVGMAAHVLRVANSAMFGFRGRVADLRRAGMLIGARGLRAVALGARLIGSSDGYDGPVDLHTLWRRSIAAAVVARELVDCTELHDTDGCFTTGLLSNIGKLAMSEVDGFAAATASGWSEHAAEIELCGVSSDEVTAEILGGWQLPAHVADSIRHRHDPVRCTGEARSLASIARVSDDAAAVICRDSIGTPESMNVLYGSASRHLGLTPDYVDDLIGRTTPVVAEVTSAFKLPPIDQRVVRAAIERARAALIDESVIAAARHTADQGRIRELELKNEKLERLSTIDGLTGIANRRTFDNFVTHASDQAASRPGPVPVGIAVVDIDHFKNVNDTFGHAIGDEVLAEVARRIGYATRQEDLCARIGGEEFAAVLFDRKNIAATAIEVAERIRAAVADSPVDTSAGSVPVTVSVGLASCPDLTAVGISEVLKRADSAMYQAKQGGRNRVHVWGDDHG